MTTPDTDLMNRLADARPTDVHLAEAWPAIEQDTLLDRIRDEAGLPPRRVRRRTALLAAVAAVSALVVVPTVISVGDASAREDILALARMAAEVDGPAFGPGTFLHVKTESLQENSRLLGDGATYETHREAWRRWDGTQWAVDTDPRRGFVDYYVFETETVPSFGSPTPEFLASLPDTATEFRAYLDQHVSGSNSHDEALFVAVTDMARSGMLDPATLSLALEAIADIGRVHTKDVLVEGRPAVEISFRRFWVAAIAVESLTIDTETAQVLRTSSSDPGGTYESTTTLLEVVDEVPADVLAVFDRYGDGVRLCADGQEAIGDGEC